MAMLTLNGLVQNVFSKPESKDEKTGEIRPASLHAQILAENVLQTGEKKFERCTPRLFVSWSGNKYVCRWVPSLQTVASCSTRFGMKRSPSRPKKMPREQWNVPGRWPVF